MRAPMRCGVLILGLSIGQAAWGAASIHLSQMLSGGQNLFSFAYSINARPNESKTVLSARYSALPISTFLDQFAAQRGVNPGIFTGSAQARLNIGSTANEMASTYATIGAGQSVAINRTIEAGLVGSNGVLFSQTTSAAATVTCLSQTSCGAQTVNLTGSTPGTYPAPFQNVQRGVSDIAAVTLDFSVATATAGPAIFSGNGLFTVAIDYEADTFDPVNAQLKLRAATTAGIFRDVNATIETIDRAGSLFKVAKSYTKFSNNPADKKAAADFVEDAFIAAGSRLDLSGLKTGEYPQTKATIVGLFTEPGALLERPKLITALLKVGSSLTQDITTQIAHDPADPNYYRFEPFSPIVLTTEQRAAFGNDAVLAGLTDLANFYLANAAALHLGERYLGALDAGDIQTASLQFTALQDAFAAADLYAARFPITTSDLLAALQSDFGLLPETQQNLYDALAALDLEKLGTLYPYLETGLSEADLIAQLGQLKREAMQVAPGYEGSAITLSGLESDYRSASRAWLGLGSVPEPSAWAMMLLGFFMVGSRMRVRSPEPSREVADARLDRKPLAKGLICHPTPALAAAAGA